MEVGKSNSKKSLGSQRETTTAKSNRKVRFLKGGLKAGAAGLSLLGTTGARMASSAKDKKKFSNTQKAQANVAVKGTLEMTGSVLGHDKSLSQRIEQTGYSAEFKKDLQEQAKVFFDLLEKDGLAMGDIIGPLLQEIGKLGVDFNLTSKEVKGSFLKILRNAIKESLPPEKRGRVKDTLIDLGLKFGFQMLKPSVLEANKSEDTPVGKAAAYIKNSLGLVGTPAQNRQKLMRFMNLSIDFYEKSKGSEPMPPELQGLIDELLITVGPALGSLAADTIAYEFEDKFKPKSQQPAPKDDTVLKERKMRAFDAAITAALPTVAKIARMEVGKVIDQLGERMGKEWELPEDLKKEITEGMKDRAYKFIIVMARKETLAFAFTGIRVLLTSFGLSDTEVQSFLSKAITEGMMGMPELKSHMKKEELERYVESGVYLAFQMLQPGVLESPEYLDADTKEFAEYMIQDAFGFNGTGDENRQRLEGLMAKAQKFSDRIAYARKKVAEFKEKVMPEVSEDEPSALSDFFNSLKEQFEPERAMLKEFGDAVYSEMERIDDDLTPIAQAITKQMDYEMAELEKDMAPYTKELDREQKEWKREVRIDVVKLVCSEIFEAVDPFLEGIEVPKD